VARLLADTGASVICTNRGKADTPGVTNLIADSTGQIGVRELLTHLKPGMIVLHSIPEPSGTEGLLEYLRPFRPSRVVYLSTTGVYGNTQCVDEMTSPAPETEREKARLHTEGLVVSGPWPSLILRPAAIYGPHRGIHTWAQRGVFRPPPGGNRVISRIHVDDLADHVVAGLKSEITGAFPVADEEPCTSLELAEWTAEFLGKTLQLDEEQVGWNSNRADGRRVSGEGYRRRLGLRLRFPTFRQGVPACLEEEAKASASNR
jgi:nucleoside-diphosphate-sugar epimerase